MKRGEVVLVDFPFSDGLGAKNRPALRVQSDLLNKVSRDTILVTITTLTTPGPTVAVMDPREGPNSGFRLACTVRADNMHTIEPQLILGSIGYLSKKTMQRVDECLKKALGL
jgi:mRNA interferase MazF